ncbi:hypothetical protein Vi05172_g9569 [Venturia inaequalis]|nr:hypothetical protein Vi05172_g9569 [Venturia inaequalis]
MYSHQNKPFAIAKKGISNRLILASFAASRSIAPPKSKRE